MLMAAAEPVQTESRTWPQIQVMRRWRECWTGTASGQLVMNMQNASAHAGAIAWASKENGVPHPRVMDSGLAQDS